MQYFVCWCVVCSVYICLTVLVWCNPSYFLRSHSSNHWRMLCKLFQMTRQISQIFQLSPATKGYEDTLLCTQPSVQSEAWTKIVSKYNCLMTLIYSMKLRKVSWMFPQTFYRTTNRNPWVTFQELISWFFCILRIFLHVSKDMRWI